ncbi:MAG TPA: hypothetical protein VMZ04_10970, partial [Anaerolineae bacterium]|nr:hypothetical protein [Anaerolineae bacterium]
GYNPGETLALQNPPSENNSHMRLDILPNILALIETNTVHRDRFFLYEIGNVFHPVRDGCIQPLNLAGIGYQSEKLGTLRDLFLSVKGTIEELFVLTDAEIPLFSISKDTSKPWCLPGACMDIIMNGSLIGTIGYVTRKMCEVFEKGTQVVWFEVNISKIPGRIYPDVMYDQIPVYPGSWMDFSILAEKTSCYSELANTLDGFSHSILKQRKFLYSYTGKGLPDGKVSYTFRFWLGLRERTLTGEDISDFRNTFLSYIDTQGLALR